MNSTQEAVQYLRDKFNRERPEDKGNEVLFENFVRDEIAGVQAEMYKDGYAWVKRVVDTYHNYEDSPIEFALLERMIDYGADLFCDDLVEQVVGNN
jgi:hypothetical protein